MAERNEAVQQLAEPDAIVATAVRLLESAEWAEIAAGLAVVTGRRISELLATATFEPKNRWSVIFTGAVKRGTEQGLAFEIPTLTTAQRVCTALSKLRRELPDTHEMPIRKINQTYEPAVARACQRHFEDLIPTRDGKENLYTHMFRAVYATIAVFWYCSPSVNDVEFRAAVQGHFQILDEKNPELRRSLAASRHYADYEIADNVIAQYNGKRKGIKLGLGGVEVLEMFKESEAKVAKKRSSKREKKTPSSVRMWKEDKELLNALFDRLNLDGDGKQEDRIRELLIRMSQLLENSDTEEAKQQAEPIEPLQKEPEATTTLEQKLDRLTDSLTELIPLMGQMVQGVLQPTQKRSSTNVTVPNQERSQSTESEQYTATSKKERKNSTKPETIQKINWAIDAILAYNNEADRLQTEKWAITINLLKELGILSVPTIEEVIGEGGSRRTELDEHYKRHQIDPAKQNYNHRGKRKITDIISILGTQETQARDKD